VERPAPFSEPCIFRHIADEPQTNKLILLSRTLAGLIDLIVIIVGGSACVFTVDVLEGISVFDSVSVTHYLLLLLLTYFVYSMFFLCTGTQTIGMMLTYLRLTGTEGEPAEDQPDPVALHCLPAGTGCFRRGAAVGIIGSQGEMPARPAVADKGGQDLIMGGSHPGTGRLPPAYFNGFRTCCQAIPATPQ